ncbi:MAG: hypothetical protein RR560_04205 [Hydrogenoanaerobacterium sp.]
MITNLSKDSVSIFTQTNNINHRKAYINSLNGRAELQADQSPKTVAEVMTVWGDKPTVPDTVPAPILPPITDQQIAALKSQIADSDYKIIKCSECKLAGKPMPYDIAALHAERQVLRDKINVLEAEQVNIKKER